MPGRLAWRQARHPSLVPSRVWKASGRGPPSMAWFGRRPGRMIGTGNLPGPVRGERAMVPIERRDFLRQSGTALVAATATAVGWAQVPRR